MKLWNVKETKHVEGCTHYVIHTFATLKEAVEFYRTDKQHNSLPQRMFDIYHGSSQVPETLKEIFESVAPIAIHCDTQEKAIKLLEALTQLGYSWCNGAPFSTYDGWEDYEENTCYLNSCVYDNLEDIDEDICTIIEFDDVIFE